MKIFALLFALLILPLPVFAYLDPASGSAIMSAMIGLFVAIGLIVKSYWYKVKSLFAGNTEDKTNGDHSGS
jgi:hypothetical protein